MSIDSPKKASPSSTMRNQVDIPVVPPSWQISNSQSPRNNLNREISYENKMLTTPESLTYEKNRVMYFITKLREEIGPLNEQYRSLQMKVDERNGRNSQIVHTNEMSLKLSELHAELDMQKENLAKYRRFYTPTTQNKLQSEIKQHFDEIKEFTQQTASSKEKLENCRQKLQAIISSPQAASIKEQEQIILRLADERDRLRDEEDELVARHMEGQDDMDNFEAYQTKIEDLKRKLTRLQREKMQRAFEFRKLKLERESILEQLRVDIKSKSELVEEQKKKREIRVKLHNDLINSKQMVIKKPNGTSKPINSPRLSLRNQVLPNLKEDYEEDGREQQADYEYEYYSEEIPQN